MRRIGTRGHREEFGITNFGYCTSEGLATLMLLKVSAPGYVPGYYLRPHLGVCSRDLRIVLARAEAGRKRSAP